MIITRGEIMPIKRRNKPKSSNLLRKLPNSHKEWLQIVLKLTEKAGKDLESQRNRLKKEISKL